MITRKYISPLSDKIDKSRIGNKASSLVFLQKHKALIPRTFLVITDAYEDYRNDKDKVLTALKTEISSLPEYSYIVRSSTNIEDSDNYSYAGQFLSIPDVQHGDLVDAVRKIYESVISIEHTDYLERAGSRHLALRCALILQKMVKPVISGVSFSRNPVNGNDEVVIEAVRGSGEDLMQKGMDPIRWRIKKGAILEGDTDSEYLKLVNSIARSTSRLRRLYSRHLDIEWVFDGSDIYFLQLRSITVEKHLDVFSNKMAQEMLPGQIKPLVWSVNIEMVNGTWIDILSRITGPLNVKPYDLARPFYYRTYFNVVELGKIFSQFGVPVESLEETFLNENKTRHTFKPGLKTLKHTFRIIRFIRTMLTFEKFFLKEYDELSAIYKSLSEKIENEFMIKEYDSFFNELMITGKRLTYLNIIIPLLMRIHNRRFSKKAARLNIDYNMVDFKPEFPELETLSPLAFIAEIHDLLDKLTPEIKEQCKTYSALSEEKGAEHIVDKFNSFIRAYGHHSDSGNDFSHPKWEEDYEYVFKMISNHEDAGNNRGRIRFRDIKYSRLRYPGFKRFYDTAGRFKIHRERISSLYIYGYGLFRKLFLMVGDELLNKGIIENRDDIFMLTRPEVESMIDGSGGRDAEDVRSMIAERKKEMKDSEDLLLPAVIYGHDAPILEKGSLKNYEGVSTSSGVYRGIARIVRKRDDFGEVNRGDVVIIPFSDVSWTPVLCKAGAIVSESGGILSHCSIIAREMGIPALVSVENACGISNNSTVTVDGSNGILTVHSHE